MDSAFSMQKGQRARRALGGRSAGAEGREGRAPPPLLDVVMWGRKGRGFKCKQLDARQIDTPPSPFLSLLTGSTARHHPCQHSHRSTLVSPFLFTPLPLLSLKMKCNGIASNPRETPFALPNKDALRAINSNSNSPFQKCRSIFDEA